MKSPQPLFGAVVFHAQQAVEKALKAYLTWNSRPFPFVHDLLLLNSLCVENDSTFAGIEELCDSLNPYAVQFRYPGDFEPPTKAQADEALAAAERIVGFVIGLLPDEVRYEAD